jgi:hypothetical protein
MTRSLFFIAALIVTCALTPCLSYGGAVSGSLSIAVVPPSGNCPTTAPAAAQRAGFTTLIYCLDGAAPANATLSNWLNCDYPAPGNTFPPPVNAPWQTIGAESFCDTQHWNQAVDPVTGKTTIHFHWNTTTDTGTWPHAVIDNLVNTAEEGWSPANYYMDIRLRSTQPYAFPGNQPSPDFFSANNSCFSISPACNAGGSLGWAPVEKDVFEISTFCAGCGFFGGSGVIDWSVGQHGFFMWQITPTGSDPTIDTYLPNWTPDTGAHTYAMLTTTDGVSIQQYCGYVDSTLIAVNDPANFITNCAKFDFSPAHSLSGTDETHHLSTRDGLELFVGGAPAGSPNSDTYIEYISVWTCAAWQTDPMCLANGITQ